MAPSQTQENTCRLFYSALSMSSPAAQKNASVFATDPPALRLKEELPEIDKSNVLQKSYKKHKRQCT